MKINLLKIIVVCILIYLCINLIIDYLVISDTTLLLDLPLWMQSAIITFIGIAIGGLVYIISLSKRVPSKYDLKDYSMMIAQAIAAVILISIYLVYVSAGGDIQGAIFFVFRVLGVPLFFVIIPAVSFYSILKQERRMFLFSAGDLLFFYIFLTTPSSIVLSTSNSLSDYTNLILFFILLLVLFEMGLKALSFESMIKRITKNRTYHNEGLLEGFDRVFNIYILFMAVFVLLSFLVTFALFQTDVLSNVGENLGMKTGSLESIILFTILSVSLPIFLWFFILKENRKKKEIIKN